MTNNKKAKAIALSILLTVGASVLLTVALNAGVGLLGGNEEKGSIAEGMNAGCTFESIESYEGDMALATTSCGTVYILDSMLERVSFGEVYDFTVTSTVDEEKVGVPVPAIGAPA